jgi:hypothetical protein
MFPTSNKRLSSFSLTSRHLSYDEEIEAIQLELVEARKMNYDASKYIEHTPSHPILLAYHALHDNHTYREALGQRLIDLVQEKRRFAHERELERIRGSSCTTD